MHHHTVMQFRVIEILLLNAFKVLYHLGLVTPKNVVLLRLSV